MTGLAAVQEPVVEYAVTCPGKEMMKIIKPAKYIAIARNRENRYLEVNREVIDIQNGRPGADELRSVFTLPAISYRQGQYK